MISIAMNVIVTGGGGDIGGACARLLASNGSNLLVVDADLQAAERVAREINEGAGGKAIATAADVSIASDVERYVARAADWGPVDGVVHAAGIAGPAAPLPEFDEAEFDRVMGVNARGTFLGMKYALPYMRDGGAIVNIASVSGIAGYPMVAAYVASKHAVVGLTRTAALEGAPRGIRVNAICPGPIKGRLMSAAGGEASFAPGEDPFLRGLPLARYGRPDEVAHTIAFLLSPAAGYISGATIAIDGGLTISPT
jgi:NAD(P)-dependent dehydrogenase (short-subunit alcohol dehydrogenase family)